MLYFGLWLVMALLFAFTLEKMLMLASRETGIRVSIYRGAAAAWFILAVVGLTAIATEHPMPYIHTYVWMGPDAVLMINNFVGGMVIMVMTVVLGWLIK